MGVRPKTNQQYVTYKTVPERKHDFALVFFWICLFLAYWLFMYVLTRKYGQRSERKKPSEKSQTKGHKRKTLSEDLTRTIPSERPPRKTISNEGPKRKAANEKSQRQTLSERPQTKDTTRGAIGKPGELYGYLVTEHLVTWGGLLGNFGSGAFGVGWGEGGALT